MLAFAFGIIAECYFDKEKISKKFEFIFGLILGERKRLSKLNFNKSNSESVEKVKKSTVGLE